LFWGGGIGSHLVEELCKSIDQGQIDPNIEISIADNDSVEVDQIRYQNFVCVEVGLNKAQALAGDLNNSGLQLSISESRQFRSSKV